MIGEFRLASVVSKYQGHKSKAKASHLILTAKHKAK